MLAFAGAATVVACQAPDREVTGVVVGVTSDLRPGVDFDVIEVQRSIDGKPADSYELTGSDLKLPVEIDFEEPPGTDVGATFVAKLHGADVVSREARTKTSSRPKILYRAPLGSSCIVGLAPSCASPQTCAGGDCVPSFVDPSKLPDYVSGWADANGGVGACGSGKDEPEIVVGSGQSDFLPSEDLDVAQVEAGPQGGFHVWIAARMRGLRQSGSVTTLTGTIPDLGYDVPAISVVFTFDPDEGGYCKIFGLRFRLDDDNHPIDSLLGHELDVSVSVSDPDGHAATGTRRLTLSSDIE